MNIDNIYIDRENVDSNGDFFCSIPWYDKTYSEAAKAKGIAIEDFIDLLIKGSEDQISYNFKSRHLNSREGYFPFRNNESLKKTVVMITDKHIPFLDIASGFSMGLAPFFINEDPYIPCIISDISGYTLKGMRNGIDSIIPGNNVSLAQFDVNSIPIQDESFDCITSFLGLTSALGERSQQYNILDFSEGKDTAIGEVYRILKPGGLFITVEHNIEMLLEMDKLKKYLLKSMDGYDNGLYGDLVNMSCLPVKNELSWRKKFEGQGFIICSEDTETQPMTRGNIESYFQFLARNYNSDRDTRMPCEVIRKIYTDMADEEVITGITLSFVHTLYVLQKK